MSRGDERLRRKPASRRTAERNRRVLDELDFSDRRDFERAQRGFIATLEPLRHLRQRDQKVVYDLTPLGFLGAEAPDTVNPSLWRQCQLNAQHHGLFEVADRIYQVRSFDLANMTLIASDTGWIVIDPLTCKEAAQAALELANRELGEREVRAVIHTHSHVDHFGGVLGVVDPADVESGKVTVLAPRDYVREALSENVMVGNVMNRRATFMFGNLLEPSEQGFVGNGLGPALSMGSVGFQVPNDTVYETGETRVLDGVELEFQQTPGTEAPTEMVFFFPQFAALCMSEIASHHLHNVYTPRGAQTRDALEWSRQLQESIDLFVDRTDVQFGSHHWPIWGREEVRDYLSKHRDLYKYLHDQTLRLANHGLSKEEISEQLELPEELGREFYNRDYYGTLSHNAKAVYARYIGYFDGHPSLLEPLPAPESAPRYVEFMGGIDAMLERAQKSFEDGEYRWVAEVLRHAVFTDPDRLDVRVLLADALEQLGYQAESGPWRNFYLTGAQELRQGSPKGGVVRVSEGVARGMPLENLYDSLSVRLNGPAAQGQAISIRAELTDLDRADTVQLERSVLHAWVGRSQEADLVVRTSSHVWKRLLLGLAQPEELRDAGEVELDGDVEALSRLVALFDHFVRSFPILFPSTNPR